jgi:hypothetical protein
LVRAPTYAEWERSVFTRCEALHKDWLAIHVGLVDATRNEWLRHHHTEASGSDLTLTDPIVVTVLHVEGSPPARRLRQRRRSFRALRVGSSAGATGEAAALDTAAA